MHLPYPILLYDISLSEICYLRFLIFRVLYLTLLFHSCDYFIFIFRKSILLLLITNLYNNQCIWVYLSYTNLQFLVDLHETFIYIHFRTRLKFLATLKISHTISKSIFQPPVNVYHCRNIFLLILKYIFFSFVLSQGKKCVRRIFL